MQFALIAAATLCVLLGIAHSVLGERYILIRLFRRDNLPKLLGGTEFTQRTLRFAWHITTVAWFGFAALLLIISEGELSTERVLQVISAVFFVHFLISLIGGRGRHFSWIVFLAISALCFAASRP